MKMRNHQGFTLGEVKERTKKKRNQKGFTLIEVIVVAAIIAILAGILVPLILKEIDEARITRAAADVRSISTAIIVMRKDTGKWPNLDGDCDPAVTYLNGDGNAASGIAAQGYVTTSTGIFDDYLSADTNACYGAKWKGPYLAHVGADPWDNAYIVNADAFAVTGPVWIISAGPDGVMDTGVAATTLQNDDVGIRLR